MPFPTVLPDEHAKELRGEACLRSTVHRNLAPRGGRTRAATVRARPNALAKEMLIGACAAASLGTSGGHVLGSTAPSTLLAQSPNQTFANVGSGFGGLSGGSCGGSFSGFWIEAHPELAFKHPGVQLIEGPVVPDVNGDIAVELLIDDPAYLGPRDRVAQIRPFTAYDQLVLDELARGDREQNAKDSLMEEVRAEAQLLLDGETARTSKTSASRAVAADRALSKVLISNSTVRPATFENATACLGSFSSKLANGTLNFSELDFTSFGSSGSKGLLSSTPPPMLGVPNFPSRGPDDGFNRSARHSPQGPAHPYEDSAATLSNPQQLVSNYMKKGKRGRQAELFPQLQQEVDEARAKLLQPPEWPDQTSPSYIKHILERCQDKVKHLSPKRALFLS